MGRTGAAIGMKGARGSHDQAEDVNVYNPDGACAALAEPPEPRSGRSGSWVLFFNFWFTIWLIG
jgi:hypothetical protein